MHVGQAAYIALAKGPMANGHVLVSPIEHIGSVAALAEGKRAEIAELCAAIGRFAASCCGGQAVAFERVVPGQSHTHVQVVPLPANTTIEAVNDAFFSAAKLLGASFAPSDIADSGSAGSYFSFQIFDGSNTGQRMAINKLPDAFPAAFGREVIATRLLGNATLADWRRCVTSKAEEMKAVQQLRSAFAPFAPPAEAMHGHTDK